MSETSRMGPETGILGTEGGSRVAVVTRMLLRVTTGPDRGLERLFDGGTLVVGSHPEADIVLTDTTVSRYHAELALLAGGVRVKDLKSTNGTFVGDSRVESIVLPAGSEVRVGRTRIEILAADAPVPEAPSESTRFGRMVGASAEMRRVFGMLERAAAGMAPVWIFGEPGTGKTLAARALHEVGALLEGQPRTGPLVEIEIHQGDLIAPHVVEVARGGTIILDRLDEAALATQEAVGVAVGRAERERLDVRWITSSRRDPRALVEEGLLRRDLFFHLAGVRIEMPPLRERLEDLPRLVDAIVTDLGYPEVRLSAAELGQLRAQPLEGNVRELRRLIEETLLRTVRRPSARAEEEPTVTEDMSRLPFKEAKERLLDAFEKGYVAQLLERAGGNVSRAADEAGIDRNHLARLAKKHGIR
ncbi:MAG: sigma 54-interacting transcriptional regulator [Sandaracinaceae bacterium]|nr:sigma 54-interacting transcriptional regulator [Sandaracinaceae bacterium]